MNANEITIDLQQFCRSKLDEGDSRYILSRPFFRGGWHIGCDTRILVALPAGGTADSDWRTPDTSKFIHPALEIDAGRWRDWPNQSYVESLAKCLRCDEGMIGSPDCPICKGEPSHKCSCGLAHSCDACDWTPCTVCRGKGKLIRPSLQPVGNQLIGEGLDLLVRTLPGVQWAESDIAEANSIANPIFLRFYIRYGSEHREGIGAVMPVDRKLTEEETGKHREWDQWKKEIEDRERSRLASDALAALSGVTIADGMAGAA